MIVPGLSRNRKLGLADCAETVSVRIDVDKSAYHHQILTIAVMYSRTGLAWRLLPSRNVSSSYCHYPESDAARQVVLWIAISARCATMYRITIPATTPHDALFASCGTLRIN